MGTDKAFLRIGDDLLIERQLQCLRESGATELLISGRPEVNYSRFEASVVHDRVLQRGPLAGVSAALKASSYPLVLVLAVDMPRMTSAMIRKILSRCNEATGCVPFDLHGFQPLAAAYPIGLLPLAEHLLNKGRFSMQEFVMQAKTEGLIHSLELEPAEYTFFTNMNLPSEWAEIDLARANRIP
jgi:molybdopterin-guanine dinucleotide biosynthesis protein A